MMTMTTTTRRGFWVLRYEYKNIFFISTLTMAHRVDVKPKSHNCCRMHTKYAVEVNIKVISLALQFSTGRKRRKIMRIRMVFVCLQVCVCVCAALPSDSGTAISSDCYVFLSAFASHKSSLILFYQIESFLPKKLNGKTPSENLFLSDGSDEHDFGDCE